MVRLEVALGLVGAALGLVYGVEHNAHVSLLTGGFRFTSSGLVVLAAAGFALGFLLGRALQRRRP
jgi:hypothetical protein